MNTQQSHPRRNQSFRHSTSPDQQNKRRFSNSSARGSFGRHRGGGGGGRPFDRRGGGGRKLRPTFDVSRYINKNPVIREPEVAYENKYSFADFEIEDSLKETIRNLGLKTPSPIQDQTIPLILEGRDVVGLAETGTGKTAAFLIPTINQTLKNRSHRTLILTPTRELAIQIENELQKLAPKLGVYCTVCVGGTNIRPQMSRLRRVNHFIIGTPGRVMDLMDRGFIHPETFNTVVLDEADRMLDMGFIHDMRKILKDTPQNKQTLFFSATMSKSVEALTGEFLRNPETISVKKKDITNSVSQDVIFYEPIEKFNKLIEILKDESVFRRVIIFGAMKHSVEKLAIELNRTGVKADAIHGNKNHGQRQRALSRFKSGQVRVLVATDVAARGIHVDNVTHVINYDLPNTFEDYVHRIGRTGRANHDGAALTFVNKREVNPQHHR